MRRFVASKKATKSLLGLARRDDVLPSRDRVGANLSADVRARERLLYVRCPSDNSIPIPWCQLCPGSVFY